MSQEEPDPDAGAITTYVPGMKPGATKQNVAIGLLYILVPIIIPFALAYVFATNKHGVNEELDGLPGFGADSVVVPTIVAFFIGMLIASGTMAVLPWYDTADDDDEIEEPEAPAEEAEAQEEDETEEEETDEAEEVDEDEGVDEAGDDPPPETEEEEEEVNEVEEEEADAAIEEPEETEAEEEEDNVVGAEEEDEQEATEEEEEADDEGLTEEEAEQVFIMTVEQEGGYQVDSAEHTDDGFIVEATSYAQTEEELAEEMGWYGGAYAAIVDEGHGEGDMTVDVDNAEGELAFTYSAEEEWAEDYNDGEITAEEYSMMILETIDPAE